MIRREAGIILPKTHSKANEIVNNLSRRVFGWRGEWSQVDFFTEYDDDNYIIPRYYPIENDEIIDNTCEGDEIEIEDNITPRTSRQAKSIDYLLNNTNGILRLEPGSGKTVIAIAAISRLKRKTIVFAHKSELLKQWKKDILNFTNLDEDDISFVTSVDKKYKESLNKKILLCTPHVVSVAIKRGKHDFLNDLYNCGIGVMFVDETHAAIGPEKFSMASFKINAKRTFGLSATPYRLDGMNDILNFHLGEIIYYKPDDDELLKPKVYMVSFKFGVFQGKTKKWINWGGHYNPSRYFKKIYDSPAFVKNVTHVINKYYKDDRTILVLGNRIEGLLNLAKECNLPKSEIGIFIPGAKSKQKLEVSDTDKMKEALQKRIVFSTYSACRDGVNREEFDCLVCCIPTSNMEQAAGRILRHHPDKKVPVVIDFIDQESPLTKNKQSIFYIQARKRLEFYEKMGWYVKYIDLEK